MAGTDELRIVALEENSYFQEKRLNELDAALRSQQAQLDGMAKSLEEMGRRLTALREDMAAAANVPPPHYQQEK